MGVCVMSVEEIKKRLESSKDFKFWSEEVGITFNDFKVIDTTTNKVLCAGSSKIGEYCIMILNDEELKVCYDLSVEDTREKRLKRLGNK